MVTSVKSNNAQNEKVLNADVVVVGAGLAGLSAALEAQKSGKKVIVLNHFGLLGNSSSMSGGEISLIGTPLQKQMGIQDSTDLFVKDVLKANNHSVDVELVNVISEGAVELFQWLTEFGVQFDRIISWPGHSVLRVHKEIGGRGSRIVELLHQACKARGINVILKTMAISLLLDVSGRVIGIEARDGQGKTLKVMADSGVVLAAGGFAKNKEMLQKYAPRIADLPNVGARGATGDGIRLGIAVGARIVNMDSAVLSYNLLSKDGSRHGQPMSVRWAIGEGIAVNKEGSRFMDEDISYTRGTCRLIRQTGRTCFIVFDEKTKSKVDMVDYVEVYTGNTAAELAAELGVDPIALANSIATYNDAVSRKVIPETNLWMRGIQRHCLQGRLFAVAVAAELVFTQGGMLINSRGQVIHESGKPIPGLYAAGDNALGMSGSTGGEDSCPGYLSGVAILTALSFGRVAGRNAAGEKAKLQTP
jgi:flavocytochrome c